MNLQADNQILKVIIQNVYCVFVELHLAVSNGKSNSDLRTLQKWEVV